MSKKQYTKKEKATLIKAVEKALLDLEEEGMRIDFQIMARRLGTARSTLYRNPTVRRIITEARDRQELSSNYLYQLQEEMNNLRYRVSLLEEAVFGQKSNPQTNFREE